MKLAELTWKNVAALSRDVVVLIPTGSIEQHGPHLPLMTDTLIATSVAEEVERRVSEACLLTPTVWLGASAHHCGFQGSLTNSTQGYVAAIRGIVESLFPHGFYKFYLVNGHGGNTSLNDIACRELKQELTGLQIGHVGYFDFISQSVYDEVLEGRVKTMRHADESEASLVMHLRPDLVRTDKLRDDGLAMEPMVKGLVWQFDEMTEEGVMGQATLGTAEKGRRLFEAGVEGVAQAVSGFYSGVALVGQER